MTLLADELSQKEIAARMGISTSTLRVHIHRAQLKTGTRTLIGLVVWWLRCKQKVTPSCRHDRRKRAA